jgi:hypothetical protein
MFKATTALKPKEPFRNTIFHVINSLARRCRRICSVPIVDVRDGEAFASGGYGIISKTTYEGEMVAIKSILRYRDQPEHARKIENVSSLCLEDA